MEKTPLENLRRADSTSGPFIATIIIIVVLIMGAVAVFYKQYQESRQWQEDYGNLAPSEEAAQITPPAAPPTATSTSLEAIEEDLSGADLAGLESEIDSLSTDVQ